MIEQIITLIKNPWIIFGFAGQFVFFLRFVVQWLASEKRKESVIPPAFWYLSLGGTIIILIYSIRQKDIVFCTASVLNALIYIRNLVLINSKKKSHTVQIAG